MNLLKVIKAAREFAYSQSEKYRAPSVAHLDLANKKGQWLAEKLGADKEIVVLGTLLMDCMLGQALQEGKVSQHVAMSIQKAQEIFAQFPEVSEKTKENIIQCVKEHYGVDRFYSREAEICCNADCYRFISVYGFLNGVKNSEDMSLKEMVKLYSQKAEEKWQALTLEVCKKELELQYKAIKSLLGSF